MQPDQIVIYQTPESETGIDVKVEHETISQSQIVDLFQSSKANISEHIKNIFESKELNKDSTVRNFRTVRQEGKRKMFRDLEHYNLDLIISVGYRVNLLRGTQFLIWANN